MSLGEPSREIEFRRRYLRLELVADHEFDTNLDFPIDQKTARYVLAGMA